MYTILVQRRAGDWYCHAPRETLHDAISAAKSASERNRRNSLVLDHQARVMAHFEWTKLASDQLPTDQSDSDQPKET